jgi:hypothetical protein
VLQTPLSYKSRHFFASFRQGDPAGLPGKPLARGDLYPGARRTLVLAAELPTVYVLRRLQRPVNILPHLRERLRQLIVSQITPLVAQAAQARTRDRPCLARRCLP